jgi:signal transduction histidine kinase
MHDHQPAGTLHTRIAALCALVALLATGAGALAAGHALQSALVRLEDRDAELAVHATGLRLQELLDNLEFEVDDYANWDELFANMPRPDPAWARINLTPGKVHGALVQVMATGNAGAITGRFRDGDVRDGRAAPGDPASERALASLLTGGTPAVGIALLGGAPALYAVRPVRASTRQGAGRGELIGLAYLDQATLGRLAIHGWSLSVEASDAPPAKAPAKWSQLGEPALARTGSDLVVTTRLALRDGALQLVLRNDRRPSLALIGDARMAIVGTGIAMALLATLLGTWLGWRWLRPITALAAACRSRASDPDHPLPQASGLAEADILAADLDRLVAAERASAEALTEALDRETTANAVHQRFLANLAHEIGQPLRRLIAATEHLDRQGGRLDPDQLVEARQTALHLEERFQEVLGLAAEVVTHSASAGRLRLDDHLLGIVVQFRPLAERKGLAISSSAPPSVVPIDARLLTPIIVNLAANALRATSAGTVTLSAAIEGNEGVWTVVDTGPGIAPELAERITAACARGEVLPGDPGLGLGLALALANARALGGTIALGANGPAGVRFTVRLPLRDPLGLGSSRFRRDARRA